MNVSQAVESRVSCRGFKKEPVEQEVLEAIFLKAQQQHYIYCFKSFGTCFRDIMALQQELFKVGPILQFLCQNFIKL